MNHEYDKPHCVKNSQRVYSGNGSGPLNTQGFTERSIDVWGPGKFDYSKADYKNNRYSVHGFIYKSAFDKKKFYLSRGILLLWNLSGWKNVFSGPVEIYGKNLIATA